MYAISRPTSLSFAAAVERARAALADEGFGVLCEIDVQAQLRAKLGEEREPYLILGACNPVFAHRALAIEPDLGALLPCSVAVYEHDGKTHVAAVNAIALLGLVEGAALDEIGAEVGLRLRRVVEALPAV